MKSCILLFLIILSIHPVSSYAQEPLTLAIAENQEPLTLTIAEYNCENLFDARHDSQKDDYEFLPDGTYHWSKSRYWKKLNAIARALVSIGTYGGGDGDGDIENYHPTDIIGLCEVENDSVLFDLTRRSLLRGARYDYLVTNSPDTRGVDVGLLYSRFAFVPLASYSLRVDTISGMRPTRDILYAKGLINNGDSIHIFVVHAPSRRGGEKTTSLFRKKVADRLCFSVDSIRTNEPEAKIIVMGDFNDYGNTPSLNTLRNHQLYDISQNAKGRHGAEATYRYQGIWNSLDHIFISNSLRRSCTDCYIADSPMLLEPDNKFSGVKPRRFMLFNKLNNGYSDHLPLTATFVF